MAAVTISAVAAAAVAAASGATLAAIATAFVSTLVLGVVSSALAPKPKAASAPSFALRDRTVTVRQSISPRRVIYGQVRVGGTLVFIQSTNSNAHLHLVIVLAGHEVEEIGTIWLDDKELVLDGDGVVSEGDFTGLVRVKKKLGAPGQTAFEDLVTESGGKWTGNHRLSGCAAIYVRLTYDAAKFSGVPNFTAIVKGAKVYDPRDETTAWSANAALCVADYLAHPVYGLGADYGDEVAAAALVAAANICDEAVTLAAGGTEARYECHGTFDTSEKPADVIPRLLSAMAGKAILSGGKWFIHAAAWTAPVMTLTEDDLRGPVKIQSLVSRRENFNAVKGVFVSPASNWQPTDFPPVQSAAAAAEDGETVWRDVDYGFTTSASMAQRLARIDLLRARQPLTVALVTKLLPLGVRAGEVVNLTLPRYGFTDKSFEVVDLQLDLAAGGEDGVVLPGVALSLRETAAAIFDWSTDLEAAFDPAPNTDLPDPFTVAPPTALVLASGTDHLLALNEGSVIARILATWTASTSAIAAQYELQWRASADEGWSSQILGGSVTRFHVAPVQDGAPYDVRVRAISVGGALSPFITVSGHVVVGKTERPPRPDSFTVARLADGTRRYTWTHAAPPADVRAGGGYVIRYYVGTTSDWSAMTALHEGLHKAGPWESNDLPAGTYTFAIKTVDSSGNESEAALFQQVVLGDPRLQNVIVEQFEHPAWTGTKTDCFVDTDGSLRALSDGDWDDLPATWDDLPASWDTILTNRSPIVYEPAVIDVGLDLSFTPLVSVAATGTVTLEMKTGTTADGAPTGSWVSLGRVTGARYLALRLTIAGSAPAAATMTIVLDTEAAAELFDDVDTATATADWFDGIAAGHFKIGSKGALAAISQARITALQNVGPGWTWELISKAETVDGQVAAEFKTYDGSGTLADAVVDIELRGPSQ